MQEFKYLANDVVYLIFNAIKDPLISFGSIDQ